MGLSERYITYNEDFLSARCIQIGEPSSALPPAIIKPVINEMAGAALRIFLHAAISNIQYGEEE